MFRTNYIHLAGESDKKDRIRNISIWAISLAGRLPRAWVTSGLARFRGGGWPSSRVGQRLWRRSLGSRHLCPGSRLWRSDQGRLAGITRLDCDEPHKRAHVRSLWPTCPASSHVIHITDFGFHPDSALLTSHHRQRGFAAPRKLQYGDHDLARSLSPDERRPA